MKEIERKFIVSSNKWKKLTRLKVLNIKQGYLSKTVNHTIRVRLTETTAFLTIKSPAKGLERDEFEYEIPLLDGQQLIKMCNNPIINKTRHIVQDDLKQVWEIDVYKGINKGLVVAEIELVDAKQYIKLPEWLGREVSYDKRYTNAYLASHKVPQK